MDLKIPKALSNSGNGYSKLVKKKMIKEHVWKKNFFSNAFE